MADVTCDRKKFQCDGTILALGSVIDDRTKLRAQVVTLQAELAGWRRGVEDANRLSQEHQARADRLEAEVARLRALVPPGEVSGPALAEVAEQLTKDLNVARKRLSRLYRALLGDIYEEAVGADRAFQDTEEIAKSLRRGGSSASAAGKIRAAEALADEVATLVRRGTIDARSPAGDALLDYREPPSTPRADRLAAIEDAILRLSEEVDAKAHDVLMSTPHPVGWNALREFAKRLRGLASLPTGPLLPAAATPPRGES